MSKWMTLPDLGHAIATKYQREVVFLSKQGSCTLFPLRDSPTRTLDRLESIAFVHNCHFVRVNLKQDCLLSPVNPQQIYQQQICPSCLRVLLSYKPGHQLCKI